MNRAEAFEKGIFWHFSAVGFFHEDEFLEVFGLCWFKYSDSANKWFRWDEPKVPLHELNIEKFATAGAGGSHSIFCTEFNASVRFSLSRRRSSY